MATSVFTLPDVENIFQTVPDQSYVRPLKSGGDRVLGFASEPVTSQKDSRDVRMNRIEETLEKLVSRLHVNGLNEARASGQERNHDDNSTLGPEDTSSNADRYVNMRSFWKPDYNNVSNVLPSREELDIETLTTVKPFDGNSYEGRVVRGFPKDRPMRFRELKINASIKEIHGLPIVFTNERLNFLMHLHKPLLSMSKSSQYPPSDLIQCLYKRTKRSATTSQEELLKQVILITLDFEEMVVAANPFSLPILEVGMQISEWSVFQSFSQLYREYEMVWFEVFKDASIPNFSSAMADKSPRFLRGSRLRSLKSDSQEDLRTNLTVKSISQKRRS